MSKWEKTIKVKHALKGDTSAEGIRAAAESVMDSLRGSGAPYAKIEKAKDMSAHDPETALLVFNDGMERIYDWADDNRVWIA